MIFQPKPYCVVYRVNGFPETEESFLTEHDMEDYCNIWLDYPDLDYVEFYYYNDGYVPKFWEER